MIVRCILLALIGLVGVGCASDGHADIQKQSFNFNGEKRNYCVYTPPGYDPQQKYPAILFLHGLFEGGNDGTGATKVGLGPAVRENPERFNCVIVFAQTSDSWRDDDQLPLAIATLDDAEKNFGIDRNRVALTGLSTGGAAVWKLGGRYPGRFSSLMPLCAVQQRRRHPQAHHVPDLGDPQPVRPVRRRLEHQRHVRQDQHRRRPRQTDRVRRHRARLLGPRV
ncbi:MAG: alpha/beta hydrolase-fold protein [Tepidisphaeraceae bacterium]